MPRTKHSQRSQAAKKRMADRMVADREEVLPPLKKQAEISERCVHHNVLEISDLDNFRKEPDVDNFRKDFRKEPDIDNFRKDFRKEPDIDNFRKDFRKEPTVENLPENYLEKPLITLEKP